MPRASTDHAVPDRSPIVVRPGDHVTVGDADSEWPAFVFVTTAGGEQGWVPARHLDDSRPGAAVLTRYDTTELPVSAGDELEVVQDDALSGWSWCRAPDGREGWVPHTALSAPSAVRLIRSDQLSDVAEYAYASTAPAAARSIHLAGACPLDADGRTVAIGDVAGQARTCVANLRLALAAAGATLADVMSTRVLVASTRQADLVEAWRVVRDAFGDHDVPSTLLGVTVLGYDGQLVEIEATAAVVDG